MVVRSCALRVLTVRGGFSLRPFAVALRKSPALFALRVDPKLSELLDIAEALRTNTNLGELDIGAVVVSCTKSQPLLELFSLNGSLRVFIGYLDGIEPILRRNELMERSARKSAMTLLLIRQWRQSPLSLMPKDVVRIVARLLLNSKCELVWAKNL